MKRKLTALATPIWLGMQITAGYIAAPVLFAHLPKLQAGEIAGELFTVISYSGLLVWLLHYFVLYAERKTLDARINASLWLLLAINQWLVTPVIEAHKHHHENWLLNLIGGSFAAWHGISSLIFMLCAILAAVLVWRNLSAKS